MAGRGPTPKENSRTRHKPQRGEWQATPGVGWQHGPIPDPPDGLKDATREIWRTWFQSWFAANWGPENMPSLRVTILLQDQVERGEAQRAGELRLWCDNLGITPKGWQDRRWKRPEAPGSDKGQRPTGTEGPYAALRAVK